MHLSCAHVMPWSVCARCVQHWAPAASYTGTGHKGRNPYYKVTEHVGKDKNRGRVQCLLKLVKCSLLFWPPQTCSTSTQWICQRCTNVGISRYKAGIVVAEAKE